MKINKDFLKGFSSLFDGGYSARTEADEYVKKISNRNPWKAIGGDFKKVGGDIMVAHIRMKGTYEK